MQTKLEGKRHSGYVKGKTYNMSLIIILFLLFGTTQTQRTTPDIMMQYFQRQLQQLEGRMNRCEQDFQQFGQKMYDVFKEIHGQTNKMNVLRSEVKGHVDTVAMRLDRVERDVEYLQNNIPEIAHVEIEDSLLEHQVKEAKLKKSVIPEDKDCSSVLTGIKSLKIVKKAGDTTGSWMKDPTKGHVIYSGFVYYHLADTINEILKVHLSNRTVTDRLLLPGAGRMPAYSLNTNTLLDLAVDEMGLWSIHADPDFGGNLVITKLDHNSLAVEHTWDTNCDSRNAEASFMICGVLYVVYNSDYGGRSSIQCVFDIHDTIYTESTPEVFFPKRYTSHSALCYHPQDKQLYAWDDGYQTIYKLDMKKVTMT
ncbi:olfactomedin-like protein 1 isoform X2 [Triplophysa dalaica]|uniref:olfactomedin-like protein 1 isoform X2 n=1 Tax=Triplophysa dalaica TaxID=1582913 RepID=UPI0024DFB659|nr:olfactomedin-like protein 1 isoform X2 [Triplophysa dalaica]